MAERFDIGDIITMKKPHPCGSKAVSYTHLDVYKRQEQIWLAGRFFVQKDTCRFSMITYTKSYMNIMCFKPVSYTHLFQPLSRLRRE